MYKDSIRAFLDNVWFQCVTMGCVVGSVFLLCIETMDLEGTFYPILAFNVFFTLEFALRLYIQPTWLVATTDLGIWIDLISVTPFYVELALGIRDSGFFRVVKMIRLFKFARYYQGSSILYKALLDSAVALLVPVYFILSFGTIWSALIFYFEKDVNSDTFTSIPTTMWFLAVTMSTVGYGDMVPVSYGGLWCSLVAMMFGIIFIAMPITLVGTNFTRAWKRKDQWSSVLRFRKIFNTPISISILKDALEDAGDVNDKRVSLEQFRSTIQRLVTSDDLSKLDILRSFRYFDEERSDVIHIDTFIRVVFPKTIEHRLHMVRMSSMNPSRISPMIVSAKSVQIPKRLAPSISSGSLDPLKDHVDALRAHTEAIEKNVARISKNVDLLLARMVQSSDRNGRPARH